MISEIDLFIQWLIFGLVVLVLAARRQLTIFHPTSVYLLFHFIVFCVRPTMIYIFDFDLVWRYIGFNPAPEHLSLAFYVSSLGLVAFTAAFCSVSNEPGPSEFPAKTSFTSQERTSFWVMIAIMAPIGLYSIFAAQVEGEHIGGVYVMTGTTGYLNDAQQVLIPVTILIIVMCRWRWWSFIPLLFFLYYRATEGWGRWTILLTVFAVVLFHTWERRKDLPSWKLLLPMPIILILFANLGLDRNYFQNLIEGNHEEVRDVLDTSQRFEDRFDTLDFANYDYLVYITSVVPEQTDTYTFGTQYLQIFTEPIPRQIWENKPVGAPVQFFDLNDYGNFLGLTPSLPGDGWMNGGWIGVVLTMTAAGLACGFLYNWFVYNQGNIYYVFSYMIVNAMIVQLFRDGGISIAKFLLFSLAPIIFWKLLSTYVFPNPPEEEYEDEELLEEELQYDYAGETVPHDE